MARDQEQMVIEEVEMNGFRQVVLLSLGLVWLAVGAGCAESNVNPSTVANIEAPADETVLTDQPVADEPGSTVIQLNKIWATQIPGTQSIHLLEKDYFESIARKSSEQERGGSL